jgi:hypothetical protein
MESGLKIAQHQFNLPGAIILGPNPVRNDRQTLVIDPILSDIAAGALQQIQR